MKFDGRETERLRFVSVRPDMVSWWQGFIDDPACMTYMQTMLGMRDLAKTWIEKQIGRYDTFGYGLYALEDKSTNELVGQCGLLWQDIDGQRELEIGYHLLSRYWGKGYAAEAARGFRDLAFEAGLADHIISIIHLDNEPSKKVARANGMKSWKNAIFKDNSVEVFKIERTEWLELRQG